MKVCVQSGDFANQVLQLLQLKKENHLFFFYQNDNNLLNLNRLDEFGGLNLSFPDENSVLIKRVCNVLKNHGFRILKLSVYNETSLEFSEGRVFIKSPGLTFTYLEAIVKLYKKMKGNIAFIELTEGIDTVDPIALTHLLKYVNQNIKIITPHRYIYLSFFKKEAISINFGGEENHKELFSILQALKGAGFMINDIKSTFLTFEQVGFRKHLSFTGSRLSELDCKNYLSLDLLKDVFFRPIISIQKEDIELLDLMLELIRANKELRIVIDSNHNFCIRQEKNFFSIHTEDFFAFESLIALVVQRLKKQGYDIRRYNENSLVEKVKRFGIEIIEHLGKGKYGSVDKVRVSGMGFFAKKEGAMKYLNVDLKIAKALQENPIFVKIYDVFNLQNYNTGFILMEYIEGVNFLDYQINSISQLSIFFKEVLDAFEYALGKNIIPIDLHGKNLMVSKDKIRIVDLGLYREASKDIFSQPDTIKISQSLDQIFEVFLYKASKYLKQGKNYSDTEESTIETIKELRLLSSLDTFESKEKNINFLQYSKKLLGFSTTEL